MAVLLALVTVAFLWVWSYYCAVRTVYGRRHPVAAKWRRASLWLFMTSVAVAMAVGA